MVELCWVRNPLWVVVRKTCFSPFLEDMRTGFKAGAIDYAIVTAVEVLRIDKKKKNCVLFCCAASSCIVLLIDTVDCISRWWYL